MIVVASAARRARNSPSLDRKSTRLNSSHRTTSYAVFRLKKKTTRHLVATTTPRLVGLLRPDHDDRLVEERRYAVHDPLRPRSRLAADDAHRLELANTLRQREQ